MPTTKSPKNSSTALWPTSMPWRSNSATNSLPLKRSSRGCSRKGSVRPALQRVAGHLLEQEATTQPQHTPNLGYRGSPIRQVVDDAEIEDRVELAIGGRDMRRVADKQPHLAVPVASQAWGCTADHVRVEIERGNVGSIEVAQQDLGAETSATADLEHPLAVHATTQPFEERRLEAPLQQRPQRVIHERLFNAVELHTSSLGGTSRP